MTSAQLLEHVKNYAALGAFSGEVPKEYVFEAANFVQEEILRELELIEEPINLTFTANQDVYRSTDTGWDFLTRLVRFKGGYINDGSLTPITPVEKQWVDGERFKIARGTTMPSPRWIYIIDTDPLSVGFWGTPLTAQPLYLSFIRGHDFQNDEISDAKNPVVPDRYRELLVLGTMAKYLEYKSTFERDNVAIVNAAKVAMEKYQQKKISVNRTGHRADPSLQRNATKVRL